MIVLAPRAAMCSANAAPWLRQLLRGPAGGGRRRVSPDVDHDGLEFGGGLDGSRRARSLVSGRYASGRTCPTTRSSVNRSTNRAGFLHDVNELTCGVEPRCKIVDLLRGTGLPVGNAGDSTVVSAARCGRTWFTAQSGDVSARANVTSP